MVSIYFATCRGQQDHRRVIFKKVESMAWSREEQGGSRGAAVTRPRLVFIHRNIWMHLRTLALAHKPSIPWLLLPENLHGYLKRALIHPNGFFSISHISFIPDECVKLLFHVSDASNVLLFTFLLFFFFFFSLPQIYFLLRKIKPHKIHLFV